jgi:hypothetical protein
METYQCRFILSRDAAQLVNLYHTARIALSDRPSNRQTPYDRMLWASKEYARSHPDVSECGAYKDLCGLLDR